jgi:protease I
MAKNSLQGIRVAILATDGFEYVELAEPRKALEEAGANTVIVSLQSEKIQGWNHDKPGDSVHVAATLDTAEAEDFDALVLPGGVRNPDILRTSPEAVRFVRQFFDAGKPVAAICHGPWLLVEAGVLKGRRLTSWPSLKTDIANAGGQWTDEEVVIDRGLVTSRKPADIPAFNQAIIEEFSAKANLQHA